MFFLVSRLQSANSEAGFVSRSFLEREEELEVGCVSKLQEDLLSPEATGLSSCHLNFNDFTLVVEATLRGGSDRL